MIPRVARRVLRAALHASGDRVDKHGALVDRGVARERVRDLDELADERDEAMRERDEALAEVRRCQKTIGAMTGLLFNGKPIELRDEEARP